MLVPVLGLVNLLLKRRVGGRDGGGGASGGGWAYWDPHPGLGRPRALSPLPRGPKRRRIPRVCCRRHADNVVRRKSRGKIRPIEQTTTQTI